MYHRPAVSRVLDASDVADRISNGIRLVVKRVEGEAPLLEDE